MSDFPSRLTEPGRGALKMDQGPHFRSLNLNLTQEKQKIRTNKLTGRVNFLGSFKKYPLVINVNCVKRAVNLTIWNAMETRSLNEGPRRSKISLSSCPSLLWWYLLYCVPASRRKVAHTIIGKLRYRLQNGHLFFLGSDVRIAGQMCHSQ